jgi:hypothetical protein
MSDRDYLVVALAGVLKKCRIKLERLLTRQTKKRIPDTTLLSRMLIEAGIIDYGQLFNALKIAETTRLPLGRVLVMSRILSERLLLTALNAQVLIRQGQLSVERAARALSEAHLRMSNSPETWLQSSHPLRDSGMKLGEMLRTAGLICDADLTRALELSSTTTKRIGEALIELRTIDTEILDQSLELQSMIRFGCIDAPQAVQWLANI